jgi:hypothetical protein
VVSLIDGVVVVDGWVWLMSSRMLGSSSSEILRMHALSVDGLLRYVRLQRNVKMSFSLSVMGCGVISSIFEFSTFRDFRTATKHAGQEFPKGVYSVFT